ncbi:hypothetical protein SO694_00061119 [Aureococcus anophagefferens]|uniref:Right handed beta helix domain-containing protein n=1 Tax=Aureococcus anophagefferens TaxID=44056 RepID=A0ABR1FRA9_AURAN
MPCALSVASSEPGGLHRAAAALVRLLAAATTSDDVTVCVGPGVHALHEPLILTQAHTHPRGGRVVWDGAGATLSGGAALDDAGWAPCAVDGSPCGGTPSGHAFDAWEGVHYHALNGTIPRQLWVRGRRAARATVEGASLGLAATAAGYATSANATAWVADAVELRWPRQVRNWIEPRCVLSAVDGGNLTVEPMCWAAIVARDGNRPPPPPGLVENVASLPPAPGAFVATRGFVFYRPSADEPYAAPTDAVVPVLESLVVVDGAANHSFAGLAFAHATWRQPSRPGGYVPTQSAVTPLGEPPGAVGVAASAGVAFDNCTFSNLGTPYALSVGNASKDVSVARCRFASLAGGAIKLGNVDDARAVSAAAADRDAGFTVADNVVRDVALEFRGAAAIFAAYVRAATIEHNAISNTGYTAVSLGWGWGTHVAGTQTWMADNHVVGNRIAGVVSALNDGGCVYTLGPQPGSTVRGNYCDSDRAPVVGSFYHDNGSRYFNTTDNVASASPAPCLFLQGCCGAPALDIAVSGVWCRNEGAVRNDCAAGAANCSAAYAGAAPADCGCRVDDVAVVDPGAPWPAAARAVVDAAGPRSRSSGAHFFGGRS